MDQLLYAFEFPNTKLLPVTLVADDAGTSLSSQFPCVNKNVPVEVFAHDRRLSLPSRARKRSEIIVIALANWTFPFHHFRCLQHLSVEAP